MRGVKSKPALGGQFYTVGDTGDLKGSDDWAQDSTRIKRKDLQKYFSGRDDLPELFKE